MDKNKEILGGIHMQEGHWPKAWVFTMGKKNYGVGTKVKIGKSKYPKRLFGM